MKPTRCLVTPVQDLWLQWKLLGKPWKRPWHLPSGRCHLVEALLGNLVDGPEVTEAGEFVEREPCGPEAPVGAVTGASAATPDKAPGSVVTEVSEVTDPAACEPVRTSEGREGGCPLVEAHGVMPAEA